MSPPLNRNNMTRDEAKKFLHLIQAFAEGKTIQVKTFNGWKNIEPKWDNNCDYRIKPETIKVYLVKHCSGHVYATSYGPPFSQGKVIKEFELEIPEGESDGNS